MPCRIPTREERSEAIRPRSAKGRVLSMRWRANKGCRAISDDRWITSRKLSTRSSPRAPSGRQTPRLVARLTSIAAFRA
jgi:hypothetical protein